MTIYWRRGDIFTSGAQTLVCPVNTEGVMGKGLALDFRKRYPSIYEAYRIHCKEGTFDISKICLWRVEIPWIMLFPTKVRWKDRSNIAHINKSLAGMAARYKSWGLTSLALPAIGCGLGDLAWKDVSCLIEKYLGPIDLEVYAYGPREGRR